MDVYRRIASGMSVEQDQKRDWKGLSTPRVGADNRAERSSCLISQSVLECTVRRRTLVLSSRTRAESVWGGYSLDSPSRVNETETIPHLDGLRLFTESSTVTLPISSNTTEREREKEREREREREKQSA